MRRETAIFKRNLSVEKDAEYVAGARLLNKTNSLDQVTSGKREIGDG